MKAVIKINAKSERLYTLTKDAPITVGRDDDCDINFEQDYISRKHARFEFLKNQLFVTGFGKNGTFINGAVIRNELPVQLKAGDTVRLGPDGPEIIIQDIDVQPVEKRRLPRSVLIAGVLTFCAAIAVIVAVITSMQGKLDEQAQRTRILYEKIDQNEKETEALNKRLTAQIKSLVGSNSGSGGVSRENARILEYISNSILLMVAVDGANDIFGYGTSFALSGNGLLCTNYHVIENAVSVYVMKNGNYYRCYMLHANPSLDLAIMKAPITTVGVKMREAGRNDIGIGVYALGFPWAQITTGKPTVTRGVLSGIADNGMLITDAAINRGNSGGPLTDSAGYVLGINTFVIRQSDSLSVEGGGFAINIGKVLELRRRYGF